MGFPVCWGKRIPVDRIKLKAVALYSDLQKMENFPVQSLCWISFNPALGMECPNQFRRYPYDCPQRDERLGWTGDIALCAYSCL